MHNLVITGTEIRQDYEGRYCLNDLHKASGGEKKHQPSNWLRQDAVQLLAKEITNSSDMRNAAIMADTSGTFVAKEMVYSYAMWISPAFNLKVIRTFDAVQNLPAIPQDPIIMLRMEQINFQKQLTKQQSQIDYHANLLDSVTPVHSMYVLNQIQGQIGSAAKWYKALSNAKHVPITATEAKAHILTMLLDREGVSDIGYIKDPSATLKYLRKLSSAYQGEYTAWLDRNSLFNN